MAAVHFKDTRHGFKQRHFTRVRLSGVHDRRFGFSPGWQDVCGHLFEALERLGQAKAAVVTQRLGPARLGSSSLTDPS